MNNVISAVDFFVDTLKQDVITLSMHTAQSNKIGLDALDGFVVQAAAKGLLVEIWIEGERRDYKFGDYVKLLRRESDQSVKSLFGDDNEKISTKKWKPFEEDHDSPLASSIPTGKT